MIIIALKNPKTPSRTRCVRTDGIVKSTHDDGNVDQDQDDDEELAQMRALGLPVSFARNNTPSKKDRTRRIETTGMFPRGIPPAATAQHLYFDVEAAAAEAAAGCGMDSDADDDKHNLLDICKEDSHKAMLEAHMQSLTMVGAGTTNTNNEDVEQAAKTETEIETKTGEVMLNEKKRRVKRGGKKTRKKKTGKEASAALPTTIGWTADTIPRHLHKYWLQRYRLFSKYDDGIMLDEECWYSATPEVIAQHHARKIKELFGPGIRTIYDAFGGSGANAIQFALTENYNVITIELDPQRALLIRNNSRVYGVDARVDIICGDFMRIAMYAFFNAHASLHRASTASDVVLFLSPPWGGPKYRAHRHTTVGGFFDLERMGGMPHLGLSRLLELAFDVIKCRGAVFFLPRNSSIQQIVDAASARGVRVCVERAVLNGREKAITAYFFAASSTSSEPEPSEISSKHSKRLFSDFNCCAVC